MSKEIQRPYWFARADEIHALRRDRPYNTDDALYLIMGMVGEAGEVANLTKKWMRGDFGGNFKTPTDKTMVPFVHELRKELADVRIYLELIARTFHIDVDAAAAEKLEEVAQRPEWKGP